MTYRALVLSTVGVLVGARPVTSQSAAQFDSLVREVRELRRAQLVILRELQELRRLLTPGTPSAGTPLASSDVRISTLGPSLGAPSAKVTVIEFSDYQCPFCGRFYRESFRALVEEYVRTGKVRFVLRDFPIASLHPYAFKAAEAAHCAGDQGKYWEMHDLLFANDGALARSHLDRYASQLGLDTLSFAHCVDSSHHAQTVRQGLVDGQQAGVSGTPAFFVALTEPGTNAVRPVNVIRGARPWAEFRLILDRVLSTTGPP